jgi:transcriptional regulator with PAS, ATPase and Fis domain
VVAATSRNLRKMVAEGDFREDLFYRLNVVSISLPPLRERPEDIPLLMEHFLTEISEHRGAERKKISPEVLRAFKQYNWPGNVRELRNTLESMMVLADGDTLTERDLPDQLLENASTGTSSDDIPSGLTMDELERLAIEKALERFEGNRTHAANSLNISVRTLQRKLAFYESQGRPIRNGSTESASR